MERNLTDCKKMLNFERYSGDCTNIENGICRINISRMSWGLTGYITLSLCVEEIQMQYD